MTTPGENASRDHVGAKLTDLLRRTETTIEAAFDSVDWDTPEPVTKYVEDLCDYLNDARRQVQAALLLHGARPTGGAS